MTTHDYIEQEDRKHFGPLTWSVLFTPLDSNDLKPTQMIITSFNHCINAFIKKFSNENQILFFSKNKIKQNPVY